MSGQLASIPKTIREQVTGQLRQRLVSGDIPAETQLREIELAKEMGVSRGPIRDAFIQLSHEGYLTYQANRGVTVNPPPNPENREFISRIRREIEIYILRKGFDGLSDEGIAEIEESLARLKEACDLKDVTSFARRDIAFHECIMHAFNGDDFVAAWRQLCSRMLLIYTRLSDLDQAYLEHVEIYKAIKKRDEEGAVAALTANIK